MRPSVIFFIPFFVVLLSSCGGNESTSDYIGREVSSSAEHNYTNFPENLIILIKNKKADRTSETGDRETYSNATHLPMKTSANPNSHNSITTESHHNQRTPSNVTCPMCGGSGIFGLNPGDIMSPKSVCAGCGGKGVVDEARAYELVKMRIEVDMLTQSCNGNYNPNQYNSTGYENTDYYSDNRCLSCNGRGTCSHCAGKGWSEYEHGLETRIMECPICHGSGRCNVCMGRGY